MVAAIGVVGLLALAAIILWAFIPKIQVIQNLQPGSASSAPEQNDVRPTRLHSAVQADR